MRIVNFSSLCCVGSLLGSLLVPPADAYTNTWVNWGDSYYQTSSSVDFNHGWGGDGWLGNSGVNQDWRLGVTGSNTSTGVVVRQVNANSPAARAGISSGDVIVCVGGDQVGRVGSQTYDLARKLNQHVDSSGRILMLVQNRLNGQLRPLQLQLSGRRGGLSGTLAVRGGNLPQNSVVTVRLENVSRPYFVVRNGQYSFRLSSFNMGDIPFQLNYDPAYISSNDTYRLRAYVTSGGRTIYDTVQPPYVLTKGYPGTARLTLRPTSYSSGNIVNVGYTPADSYSDQITRAYRRYLGRSPSSVELAAWYQTPDLNYRMQRLPLELMATQEYFDRSGATDYSWVQRSFTEVIGKAPSSVEMDLWMRRFGELRYSRTELLNQMQMQSQR